MPRAMEKYAICHMVIGYVKIKYRSSYKATAQRTELSEVIEFFIVNVPRI